MADVPEKHDSDDGGLLGRLGRGLRKGVEKGKQLGRIGLAKAELGGLQDERRDTLAEIGEVLMGRLEGGGIVTFQDDDPELSPLFANLKEQDAAIAEVQRRLDDLRDQGE